jgi:hypothetical protein
MTPRREGADETAGTVAREEQYNGSGQAFQLLSEPGQGLPEPVFPRYPEELGDIEPDPKFLPKDANPYRTRVTPAMVARAMRGWLVPYIGSLVKPGDFHPLISYLFTEWKCNLDCHYCWAYDNRVRGMTGETARRSIDWLHDNGCRVLALMGGEVLLRPQFVHGVVDYAARRGFWVYVPTNGRLMRPDVIDRLGDAGAATFNLAVDSVKDRKELPKSLEPIRAWFDYLIKKQYVYGFSMFLNINIPGQLREMKVDCQKRCFSTLNHNLAYCYNPSRAIRWVFKQAANGFRGTTGSFED